MAKRWVLDYTDEDTGEDIFKEVDDEELPTEDDSGLNPPQTGYDDTTAPVSIDGVIYTYDPVTKSWDGDDGSTFTNSDFQTYKDSNSTLGDTNGTNGTTTPSEGGGDSGGIMDSLKEFSAWAKANPDTMRLIGGLGMASLPLLGKMFPGLGNALNPQQGNPNVYQGGINMNMQANRQQLGGRNAQGRYFTDVQYSAPGTVSGGIAGGVAPDRATGINLAKIGQAQAGADLLRQAYPGLKDNTQGIPDDGLLHAAVMPQERTVRRAVGGEINGDIMVGYAKGGPTGRYLQGHTDGMADELPANIDGKQPAKLSHGEFVIPADVVSHLGNGNSDAGAKKLYSMMDKIRMARTGNKKQGKQINPDKYMPKFAGGGVVAFNTGGSTSSVPTGATGVTQGLNTTFGPYVTNMMGQANALADSPYQAYQGPLTAGASALQQQGFGMAANLAPSEFTNRAGQAAGGIGAEALGSTYSPTNYTSTYQAPAGIDSAATNFTNQFTAPGAYTPNTFTSQTFGTQEAQQYMNPYIATALNPQLDEMRRQAQITQMQNDAKMVGAGAFGGSRQALMTTENQRNLGDQMRNALGTGYKNAYDAAAAQFNADQGRNMQAQTATEQSRQFGAGQGMTAAQSAAQYGQAAQQAQEAARQFGITSGLQNAQNAAQYGQAANQLSNQDRQFGANFGMKGLDTALSAAQLQGSMGAQQNQQGIANLNAVLNAGATQRDIANQGIAADKAAFEEERANPYKMLQFKQSMLQGMPIAATDVSSAQPSLIQQLSALGGMGINLADLLSGTGTKTTTTGTK